VDEQRSSSKDPKAGTVASGGRSLPRRPSLGWKVWCGVVLPAGIVPAVGVADAILPSGLFDRPLRVVAVFLVAGLFVATSAAWLVRAWSSLRREVIAHRGLLCPRCRYPLDRVPKSAPCCPECGTVNDRTAILRLWRDFCRLDASELPDTE
jgi:hypothetical protein